jgi:hypothetical protein
MEFDLLLPRGKRTAGRLKRGPPAGDPGKVPG